MSYYIRVQKDAMKIEVDTRSKTERMMKPVEQLDLDGNLVAEYPSIDSAMKMTGILHIGECANKKRNTAGGYIWRFAEGEE